MSDQSDIVVGKQAIRELFKRCPEKVELLLVQENISRGKSNLIRLCRENGVKFQFVPQKKLDSLTKVRHQGYVAQIFPAGYLEPELILTRLQQAKLPLIVCCDQVQDQGNLGTLIRTLYAFDTAGLILTKDRSAHLGDRASKTSAGALNHLPIARVTNLAIFLRDCQEKGIWTYCAATHPSSQNVYEIEIKWPAILVLGNEHKGVRSKVASSCFLGLKIPMLHSFDSLNVAQSGAIFIGEFLRQLYHT